MTGAVWAAFSGLGFGVFQTLNRRTVLGLDVFVSTFLQLAIAGVVLVVASLVTGDVVEFGSASAAGIAWFAAAGVLHFFGGWTFLSLSQLRIGAARTSPLVSTAPVFGVAVAAGAPPQTPTPPAPARVAGVLVRGYLRPPRE